MHRAPVHRGCASHRRDRDLRQKGAHARYTTIQNWSRNVYNLVTQRAIVEAEGLMEWVDGNLGSGVTMKYPA